MTMVWIPIQFIGANGQRHLQVSPESFHASYGPRDEEPRHRPSTDAAAGRISESSEGTCVNALRGFLNLATPNEF